MKIQLLLAILLVIVLFLKYYRGISFYDGNAYKYCTDTYKNIGSADFDPQACNRDPLCKTVTNGDFQGCVSK